MQAKHFYGVKLNRNDYPEILREELREKVEVRRRFGTTEEVASYLMQKAAYTDYDPWAVNDELAKRTGIRVLELEGAGVYLAIAATVTELDTAGIVKNDMEPLGVEEILTMERYAGWLGTDTRLGDWLLWAYGK